MPVWSVNNWNTLHMVNYYISNISYWLYTLLFYYYNNIVGAIAKTSFYTETILPHIMFNMSCTGDEDTLFDCVYSEVVSIGTNCYSYEDASVICQGW